MKPRNLRAVAAFGVVLVALTGVGSSDGGGCRSHSNSGKKTDSKPTAHGKVGRSKPSATNAMSDVRITNCAYDDATKHLAARVTVRNGDTLPYAYGFTVQFTTGADDAAVSATSSRADVVVDGGASTTTELTTPYTASENVPQPVRCKLQSAGRVVQP
ncbi:hypothetical protein [Streptomyces caelestis]|uniref:hypothetical protein n=1 Tax=Streptomyces caelestis TaxID=36816 RepID=UPI00365C969D